MTKVLVIEKFSFVFDALVEIIGIDPSIQMTSCRMHTEAIFMMEEERFDLLLITDDGGRGPRLVQKLRKDGNALPIIGMSVNGGPKEKFLAAGANGFFRKGEDDELLVELIHQYCPSH